MAQTMNKLNRKNNFTMIELLIAISLFASIMVALYSALSVGIYSWKRGDQGSNLHQKARIILDNMTTDIRNCSYFSYIQLVGEANQLYFPIVLPVTKENKEIKGGFDDNVFKVTYMLDRISYRDRNSSLMRKQETFLQSLDPGRVKPREMASDIVELSFQYPYKSEEEEDDPDAEYTIYWKDEWKMKNKIPMAVKIKIVIADDKNPESKDDYLTFERTVFIPQGTLEVEKKEDELFDD